MSDGNLLILYPCACGTTLCKFPGSVLACCEEKGVHKSTLLRVALSEMVAEFGWETVNQAVRDLR